MFSSQHRKTIVWGPDQVPLQNTGYCFITFLSTLLLPSLSVSQWDVSFCPNWPKGREHVDCLHLSGLFWLLDHVVVVVTLPQARERWTEGLTRFTHQLPGENLYCDRPSILTLKVITLDVPTNRPWLEMTSVDRVKSRHKVGIWVVFRFRPLAPVGLLHAQTSASAVTSWSFGEYL